MTLQFTVSAAQDAMQLRDFLRVCHVSAQLRTNVKQHGGFFLNGKAATTNLRVAAGDVVSFAVPPDPPCEMLAQEIPLQIAYEDAHTMVLEKPAGLTVHPTRGYADGTLANGFCHLMQERGTPTLFRPINRIDRNTSGLVLCAMHAYAAPLLAQSAAKVYTAIIEGELPLGAGRIDAPIALAENSLICRTVAQNGKPSITEYTVEAAGNGYSLVQCVPITGRTHQIRVHFAHLGHPLAGDDLYGGTTTHVARHALHCSEIRFVCPVTRIAHTVQSPLALDLQNLAAGCKHSSL